MTANADVAGLERMDTTKPRTWPPKLRRLAQEALRIDRLGLHLHAAKAKRLVDAGVAVMLNGRCIVTIPARDGLMRSNARK